MKESVYTALLLSRLRRALSQAVIIKHSDSSTVGIPDFSVSCNGQTYWFEVKIPPHTLEPAQRKMLEKFWATGCPAYLLERVAADQFTLTDVAHGRLTLIESIPDFVGRITMGRMMRNGD